jgi:acetyl esterase/lipase
MPSLPARLLRLVLNLRRPWFDWNASPEQFRAMVQRREWLFKPPPSVTIEPDTIGGVPGEWLTPPDSSSPGMILYLHGGAWVLGWTNLHRRMVAHLCIASGCRALAVDYRLAPEHPFPAALDDCLAAYRGLMRSGIPPSGLVVAGDSAGGTLTLALLIALRDAGEPLPAAAVCLSPATDLEGTGESFRSIKDPTLTPEFVLRMRRLYIGSHDPRSPLLSPLQGDLRGLPSLLIHAGGGELLLSDAQRLAEKARAAGVPVELVVWPAMWHVWHLWIPALPEARRAIAEIGGFVRQSLGGPPRCGSDQARSGDRG